MKSKIQKNIKNEKGKKLMLLNYIYMCVCVCVCLCGRWWFSHYIVSNSFDPMDTVCPLSCQERSPVLPGSSVNGILQAWIMKWVAIFFSINVCIYMYMCVCVYVCVCIHIYVMPVVRVPGGERRLLKTKQLAIGEFITDSSQGLPPSPRVWGRKGPEPQFSRVFIGHNY